MEKVLDAISEVKGVGPALKGKIKKAVYAQYGKAVDESKGGKEDGSDTGN